MYSQRFFNFLACRGTCKPRKVGRQSPGEPRGSLNKQSRRRAAQTGGKGIGSHSAFAPAELASAERRLRTRRIAKTIAATGGLAPLEIRRSAAHDAYRGDGEPKEVRCRCTNLRREVSYTRQFYDSPFILTIELIPATERPKEYVPMPEYCLQAIFIFRLKAGLQREQRDFSTIVVISPPRAATYLLEAARCGQRVLGLQRSARSPL